MPRLGAEPRLRRLLALVPWIAAHEGPTLANVCTRFNCTEDELLGCKNFGQTSLNEIKQQLGTFGVGLRKLEE